MSEEHLDFEVDESMSRMSNEEGYLDDCVINSQTCSWNENDRLQLMEDQQEMLNSSLMALTSHFAQVQLRLRQIVEAPPDEKENLLKELEEFANRGIPLPCDSSKASFLQLENETDQLEEKINIQRIKQKKLITQLKAQLEDLEQYAYETGDAELPQSLVMERQKLVIDQLKGRLNLNIDHIDQLTMDDLKVHIDHAIAQLVSPMKMKEQLVTQLKTQITDLERFIEFLQGGSDVTTSQTACTCKCPLHRHKMKGLDSKSEHRKTEQELRARTINIIRRVVAILHVFAGHHIGQTERFTRNILKKTMKVNHWGDTAAELQLAIDEVVSLAQWPSADPTTDSDYVSDSEASGALLNSQQCNSQLVRAVRKNLAPRLQQLLQHGLSPVNDSLSLVQPFLACLPQATAPSRPMHAWELLVKYYEMKKGDQYNASPACKLSQSFNLDLLGSSISNKQKLLSTIGNIQLSHSKFKRSYDSHFKAFVCEALNLKTLVIWLRIILRSNSLIDQYYQPWSYVVKTGFEDSFRSLEKLSTCTFNLPVDSSIRPFQNIRHAF
ncbi:RUN domain-containing protein 1 isoform X1 [Nilaparvata lugens]|uniref:RUN domain-containing protein 1 isoform X1 n=1 Tax=Nilaparvata lugens TaxID=108931 RepID=UPI000B99121A|nr:RUN domain-containing protein 1 isoform X1 [Nilaparvata lugens]XP_039297414.1 RUN domain-containing protein 1 isoform X1 [Nilaparvata lugens]